MTVATIEPTSVRAGDSLAWTKTLDDYPATAWTLKYAFKNASLGFEITATASGSDHAVLVTPTTSAAYTAGTYAWQARVTNIADATLKYTVDAGELTVAASLFTTVSTDPLDVRTFARKMLDQVELALLAVLTQKTTGKGIKAYSIAGRSMEYSDADTELARLERSRDRWRLAVAREEQAEGKPNNLGRNSYVSFGRAA